MNTVGRPELYSVLYQAGNSTDSSTADAIPATVPTRLTVSISSSADGWVTCLGPDGFSGISSLKIVPFGTDTTGHTFKMLVYGWTPTTGNTSNPSSILQPLWVPTLLASFNCTLAGTTRGIAGTDVNSSQFFCSAITLATGNANYTNEIVATATTTPSHVVVAVKDAHYISILFDVAGGGGTSAASANALVQRM